MRRERSFKIWLGRYRAMFSPRLPKRLWAILAVVNFRNIGGILLLKFKPVG